MLSRGQAYGLNSFVEIGQEYIIYAGCCRPVIPDGEPYPDSNMAPVIIGGYREEYGTRVGDQVRFNSKLYPIYRREA